MSINNASCNINNIYVKFRLCQEEPFKILSLELQITDEIFLIGLIKF